MDFAAPNSSSLPPSSSSTPLACVEETTSPLHCSDDNGDLHSQSSICKNAEGGAPIAVAAAASPWRNSAAAPSSEPKNNKTSGPKKNNSLWARWRQRCGSNVASSKPSPLSRHENNKVLTDITNTTITNSSNGSNSNNNHDGDDVSVDHLSNLSTDICPPCASTTTETPSSSSQRKRTADAISSNEDDTVNDPCVLDPRGINYCRQNQDGKVDQDGGAPLAFMRSIVDFISTKLKKKIVINCEEDRYILPDTSLRHGNDPQVINCLKDAIVTCLAVYDSQPHPKPIYNETNEDANELYELMTGASMLFDINISLYDVETKDYYLRIFCPSNEPVASLILAQYTDGDTIRIDLTFTPEYVDFDKVFWKLDTNPFPQNFNPEYDELLKEILNDIFHNRAGLSYKDHALGVMRLVPLHLLNTRQGRERILGRFLPELLWWLRFLVDYDIHPSETPLDIIMDIDLASEKAIEEGIIVPTNGGGYMRASWMTIGERCAVFDDILDRPLPLLPAFREAHNKLTDLIEGWLPMHANKHPNTPSLLTYFGESLDIPNRLKQENNSEVVDGAKLNYISGQYFYMYEMMISHAERGKKFECLLLEAMGLTMFVGAAHLREHYDFRALSSSFDGLNDVNGGGAHFAKRFGGDGIKAVVEWLRSHSRLFASELVMSSTFVPNFVRWYAEFHQGSIERMFLDLPLNKVTVSILQRYQSSKGGSAKRKSEDSTSSSTTTTMTTTTTTLTRATNTSSPSIITGLSQDFLGKVRLRPSEEKLYKSDKGYTTLWSGQSDQVCRVEMKRVGKNGIKWEQCDKLSQGKSTEGCCRLHFNMFESLDAGNDKKWKKEEKKVKKCSAKDCDKEVTASGKCDTHYRQDLKKRKEKKVKKCSVKGCGKAVKGASGKCDTHYRQDLKKRNENKNKSTKIA